MDRPTNKEKLSAQKLLWKVPTSYYTDVYLKKKNCVLSSSGGE